MSFKVIFFVLFQTLVAKQCTWTRNSVLSYHYYHTLTYVGDRSFIQCYTWEYRWQYMIACVSVYTVALELVASSSSSQSCFSRLVPCGVLVWFLQRGLHLAIQGSLRRKYHFFFLLCLCMLRTGSSDWYCGGSVSPCLTGWDRLVSGHRPQQLMSAGCVFISENKIPLQCNSVRSTWKVDGTIVKKREKKMHSCALLRIYFVTLPWRRCQETHL